MNKERKPLLPNDVDASQSEQGDQGCSNSAHSYTHTRAQHVDTCNGRRKGKARPICRLELQQFSWQGLGLLGATKHGSGWKTTTMKGLIFLFLNTFGPLLTHPPAICFSVDTAPSIHTTPLTPFCPAYSKFLPPKMSQCKCANTYMR